ncbi:hypothetical protein ONZ43_g2087 [Nemania bipapillata]|uniref:Uncharacterized protein n=1 Tax=Nemania bipapillata TaxID=110536 RepID=A0ACC2J216_9PEZI|nr:hypothetical protein ONZ43_g2087 [Nemania bipapillata]
MDQNTSFLRFASPGERRLISREDLGFYSAVAVGAVYDFSARCQTDSTSVLSAVISALKQCVRQLPHLSIIVRDAASETPFYERVSDIDIKEHLSLVDAKETGGDDRWLEELLESTMDSPMPSSRPPWRVTICPKAPQTYYVLFAYSHMIGDGMAGPAFHRAFLEALHVDGEIEAEKTSLLVVPSLPFPEPFDTPERLPISWSFLLGPLIAALLPGFVAKWLQIRAHASKVNESTWTGGDVPLEPETYRSRLKIFAVDAEHLRHSIDIARAHDAKLTAVIHQLIVRALSKCVTDDNITNFVSQTAISMRASIGASREIWGNYASGHYGDHPRVNVHDPSPEDMWEKAASLSKEIAESTTRLHDQPIGLLRYAPNIRKWLQKKLGGRRDCSYELSNLMSFDTGKDGYHCCKISKMIFAQPGNVVGAPISFNLASVKGGPLVCTITWQQGALGVPVESEDALVNNIRNSLREEFASVGGKGDL